MKSTGLFRPSDCGCDGQSPIVGEVVLGNGIPMIDF